jgi:hypothetical protein
MTFELNARKLLGMFAPLWLLLGLSLAVNPEPWRTDPWSFAWIAATPLAATGALWLFGRRRWRLELTPETMIHHTIGRTEVFEWRRMGPIGVHGMPVLDLVTPSTLHFAYEGEGVEGLVGKAIGRRLLTVFGDGGARRLVRQIEDYRRLHAPVQASTI